MAPRRKSNLAHEGAFGSRILYSVTPRGLKDLLFSESVDGRIPGNEKWEYDTPHWNKREWPHHVLVHVEPDGDQGQQVRWYAAKREYQDLYNFESAQADIGGTKFNLVIRTYIWRRSDEFKFRPPTMGDVMPDVPAGLFAMETFILGECLQQGTGNEHLDSVFVLERRTYIDRQPITTQELDDELGIVITKTTRLYYRGEPIPGPPADMFWGTHFPPSGLLAPGGPTLEIDQISDNWWATSEGSGIKGPLDDYYYSYPVRVDLGDMPKELLSITVIWNRNYSIGTQDYAFYETWIGNSGKTDKSAADEGSSSASVQPEVQLKFRDIASSNLMGTRVEFFMANPVTEAKILSRTKAIRWPVFKPESITLTATGQSISVSVHVNINLNGYWNKDGIQSQGWARGSSDSLQAGLSVSSVQTPSCIHGNLTVMNAGPVVVPVSTTAYMNMTHSVLGSIASTLTKSGTATGAVSPTMIPAVKGPTAIPTSGLYLMDVSVHPYRLGYSRVSAILFDASKLK